MLYLDCRGHEGPRLLQQLHVDQSYNRVEVSGDQIAGHHPQRGKDAAIEPLSQRPRTRTPFQPANDVVQHPVP